MAGTLALIGGAEWTEGCEFDAELLAAAGSDRVLIMAAAAAYENPAAVVDRARQWFEALGASVDALDVYRHSTADTPGALEAVRTCSMIYLAGGSPMHLRSVLKSTELWDAIVARWRDGAVLAGSAEGATVMCTHMVDTRGGAFTVGLDLVDRLTVIPRYNLWSEDKWHRTVRLAPEDLAVVGIDERTALIWDGAKWRLAGTGRVVVYLGGRRVDVDDLSAPTA